MLVNLAIWGNAITLYVLRNYFDIVFSFYSFFAFATIGCICLILGIQLRTIQNKEKERISIKKHFSGLFNPEIFQKLLTLNPQIKEMAGLDITLHSQNTGDSGVMIVTNPNCKNCARIHRHVKEIASKIPVSLVLLTFPMINRVRKLRKLSLQLITLMAGIRQCNFWESGMKQNILKRQTITV